MIKSLGGEIIVLKELVKTVEQASRATGMPPSSIIKSLVFISESGPVLVIVPGDRKVSIAKLASIVGKCRLARPNEVKEITGFNVGGMPPVGVSLRTIVDKSLLDKQDVIGGGGDIYKLCRLNIQSIIKYQNAEIHDVT